jgi:hypothetical protein
MVYRRVDHRVCPVKIARRSTPSCEVCWYGRWNRNDDLAYPAQVSFATRQLHRG